VAPNSSTASEVCTRGCLNRRILIIPYGKGLRAPHEVAGAKMFAPMLDPGGPEASGISTRFLVPESMSSGWYRALCGHFAEAGDSLFTDTAISN
jgi:hypothetical protein